MPISPGTVLTCTNDDCGCRLQVMAPCPHGDDYTCACGHALAAVDADGAGAGSIPPTPGA
jgi:hypothetical protein